MTKIIRLLTIPEAAGFLRVSVRTLHRYIKAGKFKVIRITKEHMVRITEKDLNQFIKKHKVK